VSGVDPDTQPPDSGNPGSYHAIRTSSFTYVEYADGQLDFHDLRRDPFELHDLSARLTTKQLFQLHHELHTMRYCQAPAAAGMRCTYAPWPAAGEGKLALLERGMLAGDRLPGRSALTESPPQVRRAVLHGKGGDGRREFEPLQPSRSTR
jgi:hypothetical protein